jgi:hypothetical protein
MAIDRRQFEMRERRMPEHMANLDKLVPASFRGSKFAVLEISDAVQVDARRGEDPRTGKPRYEPAIVLRFKEFPNRIYWLNTIGVNILADQYGDEETEWVGKKVPLKVQENVRNPSAGGTADMIWVANSDEWDTLFAQADELAKKKSAPPRAAAAQQETPPKQA